MDTIKEIFQIKDTSANQISYYLVLVFLVSLPFDPIYSELALTGLLLHTMIHLRRAKIVNFHLFRIAGLPVLSLYILIIFASAYSSRLDVAWLEWGDQLALLLFPLIFYFTELDLYKYRRRLLNAFAFTCLITTIYLYWEAFRIILHSRLPLSSLFSPLFINHRFLAPIDLHATYFSMYVGISLVSFAWLTWHASRRLFQFLYGIAFLVLLLATLQLAARAVCFAMLVTGCAVLPYFFGTGKARWRFLAIFLLLAAFCCAVIARNDTLHNRYLVQLRKDLDPKDPGSNGYANDNVEPRVARWQCAWELIRESPFLGYGTGTEKALLKRQYYDHRLYISYRHELDAHSQYLSFWLKTGIIGLLLYLFALGLGSWLAYRSRDPFLAAFLIIIAFVSFSENILDNNKGIFFFAFFFSLFFSTSGVPVFTGHYRNKNTLPVVEPR